MIKVLLFAQLQETVGKEQVEVDVSDITVQELKKLLKEKYQLPQIDHVMTAVNEEFAQPTDIVTAGDVVALIPPVSGG